MAIIVHFTAIEWRWFLGGSTIGSDAFLDIQPLVQRCDGDITSLQSNTIANKYDLSQKFATKHSLKVLRDYFATPQKSVYSCHPALDSLHLNTLKKLWEISEGMEAFQLQPNMAGWRWNDLQGGRTNSLDLEAEWQRVLEVIQ